MNTCMPISPFHSRLGLPATIRRNVPRLPVHSALLVRAFSLTRTTANDGIVPGDDSASKEREGNAASSTDGRLLLAFTCNRCGHRQARHLSRRAYYTGVVIIQCDGCKSKHLIADHLDWFRDGGITVEQLMREKGESVTWLQASDLADPPETSDRSGDAAAEEPLVEIPSEDVARLREILGEARARIQKDAAAQCNGDKD
ncbi:DNL zinc finger-domain-containing protein [Syncephalis pseudoplumigaleata]|uniref:DNL zinc finger-domain-containing protein n=1 Tax=Syncephalis pseudoplumigaleata TaxID=1712513 RepID=A0A4P9Z181_9FUNG|nr:DNL zinc finger-domain-containing protein [Syncephalis pseudoplumigaleata]|eukprot:RKP25491.1 DNL zinc finger-domain-containing protein [Syncephalis pseudoplumigaleata]